MSYLFIQLMNIHLKLEVKKKKMHLIQNHETSVHKQQGLHVILILLATRATQK